ncbi:MAG: hypothetical protein DMF74_25710 [Acidobacteria bacterium]|nr:MAG: hypothetical protein DMF74_25710 [Acidobacteriota bacterium]
MACHELRSILVYLLNQQETMYNVERLLSAMIEAGLGTASLTNAEDVLSKEITIFTDRIRLDVQTSTPGISFEQAWQRRVTMNYRGQTLEVISVGDLIASKTAAGRDVDLEDVRILKSKEVNSTHED